LDVSQGNAALWLEALEQGCSVDEANARIGIVSHEKTESFLTTVAKKIGAAAGSVAAAASEAAAKVGIGG